MLKGRDNFRAEKPAIASQTSAYFMHHVRTLFFSLGKLYRAPAATLMTMAVVGIALALPTGLFVLLNNLQSLSGNIEGSTQVSLYLHTSVSDARARQLSNRLGKRGDIMHADFISREQGLAEYKQFSGFGEALDALDSNPLPAVITLQPLVETQNSLQLSQLLRELQAITEVELAQLDLEWVERLFAIMDIAKRAVVIVSILFSLAVLLVIGNTIRLDIQGRREEIVVTKLIGATDAFIRRPFLYGGFWYGLMGGIMAWILVAICLALLSGPVSHLTLLYSSSFSLTNLGFFNGLWLILISTTLGLLGSWLAVGKHLDAIEPT
ncbi:MAG: cell division protein FtsX [Gammaproteobacteria bacterium]|nr:cell division protein FtsX [Gammaproteobacteria bacterium]